METEEELQARERWRERLKNIPEPELADEATLARFETALKEYRAEKAALEAREERLREIRQAAGAQDRTGFTRVGALIPAEYMPKGDAYEDPDDDVPPPPEVS
ncbi:MAG TPA: hypothetical protein VJX71_09810 [Methylomirabilota bacterium]|nr:hypothetical protein [Methylomirabilota bacterium]